MNEPTQPLAGYGTHLRKSRDLLLIERDEARVGQQMAEHANDGLVARVERLEAENKKLTDVLLFYGDERHYIKESAHGARVLADGGDLARRTLIVKAVFTPLHRDTKATP